MLVTGGWDLTSSEVLSATGTPLCTLPPLYNRRYGHTQDGLLTCGGEYNPYTCDQLSARTGGWVVSHNLLEYRAYHSSWISPAGLVLMGGVNSPTTTELLSSSDSTSSYSFNLEYETQ